MIVNKDEYRYHCIVKKIYTGTIVENNLKYSIIKGFGHCEVNDMTKQSGKRLMKQDVTIYCYGGLSYYVDSEISEGDKILAVGQWTTHKKTKGGYFYYEQTIQATEIYKNEWIKYYKGEKV